MVVPLAGYRYRRHSRSTSHRISAAQLDALMQADRDFARDLPAGDREAAQALRKREQSILDSLAYDALISALKEGALPRAMKILASRPNIAPYLGDPVAVRIERLRSMLNGKKPPGAAA
jgi:succinoglycan biosynthesis protein ExoO